MCTQVNSLFKCGHRAFNKFDNCPEFVHNFSYLSPARSRSQPPTCITGLPPLGSSHGRSCLGAGGNHKDVRVDRVCQDCKLRESQGNSPAAGTPDSTGGGSGGEKKDPWWEGDPWRKYRKG
ncbi:hypothetical protein F5883DRAFT_248469 [Diaporthe sp. PMI_573]|nr:hypothetical protein F5883DRAFT_248469 [Diaporthaceae sp. PMI_573]